MIPELLLSALIACDPVLTALFTPAHPQWGRYEVCTTAQTEDAVVAAQGARVQFGAVELMNPLDAFGTAGPYDRARLARLYGGRRALVVHGWARNDGVFETTTLVSPYPDATLSRLFEGTMVITVRWVARGGRLVSRP